MAGLIHNILQRSRRNARILAPRNPGIFEPPNAGLPDLGPTRASSTNVTVAEQPAPQSPPIAARKVTNKQPQSLPVQPDQQGPYPSAERGKESSPPQSIDEFVTQPQPNLPDASALAQEIKQGPIPAEHSQSSQSPSPSLSSTSLPNTQPAKPTASNKDTVDSILESENSPLLPTIDLDGKLSQMLQRIEQLERSDIDLDNRPLLSSPQTRTSVSEAKVSTQATSIQSTQTSASRPAVRPQSAPPPSLPKIQVERPKTSIEVSIGSIEFVEASTPAASTHSRPHRPKVPTPKLTLSQYLNK